jgi:hypothetical protein
MNNKSLLDDLDLLIAEDSNNSYSKIKLTLANLVTYLNTKITGVASNNQTMSLFDSQWFLVSPNSEYIFTPAKKIQLSPIDTLSPIKQLG